MADRECYGRTSVLVNVLISRMEKDVIMRELIVASGEDAAASSPSPGQVGGPALPPQALLSTARPAVNPLGRTRNSQWVQRR
jgi:hypothetical protein